MVQSLYRGFSNSIPLPRSGFGISTPFHFYQHIVESRPSPQIRQSLRCHVIRVASVARQLLPPHRQRDDDSLSRFFADARFEVEFAAIVEDAHAVAVLDVSRGGV